MKRINRLGVFLILGAATLAAASEEVAARNDKTNAASDDIPEFLALAVRILEKEVALANDGAPATVATDARLRRYLGLGFAQGLDTDPTGLYRENCQGNGHSGIFINSFGYRDCGDPSPSD